MIIKSFTVFDNKISQKYPRKDNHIFKSGSLVLKFVFFVVYRRINIFNKWALTTLSIYLLVFAMVMFYNSIYIREGEVKLR